MLDNLKKTFLKQKGALVASFAISLSGCGGHGHGHGDYAYPEYIETSSDRYEVECEDNYSYDLFFVRDYDFSGRKAYLYDGGEEIDSGYRSRDCDAYVL